MDIVWQWYEFEQLTPHLLYDLLKLRQDVFVIEQNCLYAELDGKDKPGYHLLGRCGETVVATTRVLPPGISYPEASLGRVAIHPEWRGKGLGHILLAETLKGIYERLGDGPIRISAQLYLKKYYEAGGFEAIGETYLEDGIPHIAMMRSSPKA